MAIRADSYSSTTEVKAYTRHLLDGQQTFNAITRPSVTELEKFIDRSSALLNVSLMAAGFVTPITHSTGRLICDEWVTEQAVAYVELTQRGAGSDDTPNARYKTFFGLSARAKEFALENAHGFKHYGIPMKHHDSDGLIFTGQTAQSLREDPIDTSMEQPEFTRKQFDNK
jgi:hypothetical protein